MRLFDNILQASVSQKWALSTSLRNLRLFCFNILNRRASSTCSEWGVKGGEKEEIPGIQTMGSIQKKLV